MTVEVPDSAPLFHPLSRRFHIILLCMFGIFTSMYMNVNLAIAMTCMVNSTANAMLREPPPFVNESTSLLDDISEDTESSHCSGNSANGTPIIIDYGGSLIWDQSTQNWLFSAAFWGGAVSIIPSIFLVQMLSPKLVFLTCILVKAISCTSIPFLANNLGFGGVFVARFIIGASEAFIYPSVNTILANWFPVDERSTAISLFTTGNQLALILGNPIAAIFCQSGWGWPAVFYFSAIMACLWSILWIAFSSNNHNDCKVMTSWEREYLDRNNTPRASNKSRKGFQGVPWIAIMTNFAFLAHLLATMVITVQVTVLLVYLPSYFKDVLHLGVIANGKFSALPTIFNFGNKLAWSLGMDKLKHMNILTPTQSVKISQCLPTFGAALGLFIIVRFVDCSTPALAFGLFCLIQFCIGPHTSGAYTSLLSLAPQYTPTLSSLSVSSSMAAQLITPFMIGVVNKTGTLSEWNMVFLCTAILNLLSGTFFVICGSGDVQPFAKQSGQEVPEQGTLLTVRFDTRVSSGSVVALN